MKRRELLHYLAAAPVVAGCKQATPAPAPERPKVSANRMPVVFLAHGAPPLLDDEEWVKQLGDWAAALPKPKAVLMVSAHWATLPAAIGATTKVPLVYDFYGFPKRYYEMTYASPGAPELAHRVESALQSSSMDYAHVEDRGLDHGAYVPMMCMYPKADVPTLQVSLPGLDPKAIFEFGKALAPLRDEGVLIIGSGFLTHNLREGFGGGTPQWAKDFDGWAQERLAARDVDALIDFRNKAPAAARNHPTIEHYVPVLLALGASPQSEKVSFPIEGWWGPTSFTKRSVQFG
ncbi:MAG: class III extradiol ring-cleavage dioxygenase [Myxococcaceae bacterium]